MIGGPQPFRIGFAGSLETYVFDVRRDPPLVSEGVLYRAALCRLEISSARVQSASRVCGTTSKSAHRGSFLAYAMGTFGEGRRSVRRAANSIQLRKKK